MTLTIDLSEEERAALMTRARTQGLSVEQYVRQMLAHDLEPSPTAKKPLASRIREIWADMPEEVRTKLPADGASQHDHYIYGVPKKTL